MVSQLPLTQVGPSLFMPNQGLRIPTGLVSLTNMYMNLVWLVGKFALDPSHLWIPFAPGTRIDLNRFNCAAYREPFSFISSNVHTWTHPYDPSLRWPKRTLTTSWIHLYRMELFLFLSTPNAFVHLSYLTCHQHPILLSSTRVESHLSHTEITRDPHKIPSVRSVFTHLSQPNFWILIVFIAAVSILKKT